MLQDQYGRIIHYLRISLTDMCNLRCIYCMPEDMTFRHREQLLTAPEICRLGRVFAELGFNKYRLTGGEPTLREDLIPIVEALAEAPGVEDLALTTNAILLKRLAGPLAAAGLRRVNVSLDTTDPDQFQRLTRWGSLRDVWEGIAAAEEHGLGVKINAVIMRGYNDEKDVVELARLSLEHAWQVRFIEVMPIGSVADFQKSHIVTEEDLRSRISADLGPLELQNEGQLEGEARVYRLAGAPGTLGFISSVTQPFCAGCNRARLTADGRLRLCLLRDKELNLLPLIREGATDEELSALIKDSVWFKPWGHGLADDDHPTGRVMSEIGG